MVKLEILSVVIQCQCGICGGVLKANQSSPTQPYVLLVEPCPTCLLAENELGKKEAKRRKVEP